MVEILIRGGDTEAALAATAAALREVFVVEPSPSRRAPEKGKAKLRTGTDLPMLVLAIPPAVTAMLDLAARLRLLDRLNRLITHAQEQRKTTGATLLIDPGDGKPIPLEQAHRDKIMAALGEVEARLKEERAQRG
jgi:hypothetical protein